MLSAASWMDQSGPVNQKLPLLEGAFLPTRFSVWIVLWKCEPAPFLNLANIKVGVRNWSGLISVQCFFFPPEKFYDRLEEHLKNDNSVVLSEDLKNLIFLCENKEKDIVLLQQAIDKFVI